MSATLSSEIASLLFMTAGRIRHPKNGRVIRFDVPEPDIRFSTGPVQKRVLCYMSEYTRPLTVSQLAAAVSTRNERVVVTLKHLLADDKVTAIQVDEQTVEYTLKT